MDWHQGSNSDRNVHFIPAEKGWLALFEEMTEDGLRIHADPVVAWRLAPHERGPDGRQPLTYGQAVVGASPWLEKAESEHSAQFFALVREDQLDPEFAAELKASSQRSKAELFEKALNNHASRNEGHASWRRQRRGGRNEKVAGSHLGLFAL